MPVNMVVRRTAMDGFVAPALYALIFGLPNLVMVFFKAPQVAAAFLASPGAMAIGAVLLAFIGWGTVKIVKMVRCAWQHRDIPIIDMDDDWMAYRVDRDYTLVRVFYKDIFRVHLRQRGEENSLLILEMAPDGPMQAFSEPIEIDLSNTNAQPEDVCDAIAERVVQQNPNHGQGSPLPPSLF